MEYLLGIDIGTSSTKGVLVTAGGAVADSSVIPHRMSNHLRLTLARGQFGKALVLGTDGALRALDPNTGAVVREVKVTAPWVEDANWQEPRPAVFTLGSPAYVTEPSTKSIVAVDIPSGVELRRGTLERTPDEVSGVPGVAAA
ncbi:hypothetical protein [Tsukamurella pseudospumae]|uniref:Carbohydrate kinase FGGY N-terminal domain-containing protein n=1 Tax=Tsukamurella pseudospumae TaxID=239498 RepID=A0A137YZH6_9ACTN|nr:hypothetical protein [Tsukamurella pseudospumae]KXO91352.1 hypothetical protein AXK61_07325 [Tsukamurella pseudospumae]